MSRRKDDMMDPGLIVAPLTPFTADLDVDKPALRRQIDYVVEDCGATMVVAAGVETQEYTYLSLEKRKALIQLTIDFVGGRVPVMVGISPSVLPDRDRARSSCGGSRRRRGAAVGADAPVRRAAHAGRPHRLFRGGRA